MKTLMLSDEQTDYRCDNVQLQTRLAAPQTLHRGFYYQAQTHFQLGAPDVFSGVNMPQQPDYKLWAQHSALYPGPKSWVQQVRGSISTSMICPATRSEAQSLHQRFNNAI